MSLIRLAITLGPLMLITVGAAAQVDFSAAGASEEALLREFHDAAIRVADWMVENQVQSWPDANNGRFLSGYNIETGSEAAYDNWMAGSYPDNWMTGASMMGLLMAYHRTGDARYLEAAELGASYLKSMQILDVRNPQHFGAFREITPQYTWCYTRDALTAAWALLWVYEETGDEECLARVRIFNEWFTDHAMAEGWPYWQMNFRSEPFQNADLLGSFHGGSAAYFFDVFRVTGDDAHLDRGVRFIADNLVEHFLREDGSYRIVLDREGVRDLDGVDDPQFPLSWQIMHRYNDDFGAVALLGAHRLFGNEIYLDRAEAFARWLISEQQPSGAFGAPFVNAASATGPILLTDLHRITGSPEYRQAALRAGRHLLTLQADRPDDPRAHGGFCGMSPSGPEVLDFITTRTSAYALIALLKLEGVECGPYYSVCDREGNLWAAPYED